MSNPLKSNREVFSLLFLMDVFVFIYQPYIIHYSILLYINHIKLILLRKSYYGSVSIKYLIPIYYSNFSLASWVKTINRDPFNLKLGPTILYTKLKLILAHSRFWRAPSNFLWVAREKIWK